MKINPVMNNQIRNNVLNPSSNINFEGKREGFFTKTLNRAFHLDEHIARGTAKLSQTKISKDLVDWTRKRAHGPARWCDMESVAVTFFYMWNTWKSDKVDEERKVPSMIQNGAVTIASSAAAALIDAALDPAIDKIGLKYMELEKTNPDLIKEIGGRSAKDFYSAIKKLKSNTVFTAVVRFIIPVMMVPVVGKIVAKLNEKKKEQEEENKEQNLKTQIQAPEPQIITQPQNIDHNDDDDDDHDEHDDFDNDKKVENNTENKFKALFA